MPNCSSGSFNPTTCILFVPKKYLQDYRDALGNECNIFARSDGDGDKDKSVTQCEAPIITYADGVLHFYSSTLGAEYHYVIKTLDATTESYSKDGDVTLSATYKIFAYATADGYQPSDKATATLYWINANLENDPSSNINQTKTRGIVATSKEGVVTLSGLDNGEVITFYTLDGRKIGAAKAENGTVACSVDGTLVVAKFGNNAIKITVK